MTSVHILPLGSEKILSLISQHEQGTLSPKQIEMLDWCEVMSNELWTGWIDDCFVAVWGVIPPTLISTQGYLWMHTTEAVQEHAFLFVRHSQRMIEEMLTRYDMIVGHCLADARKSQRWVKWLGGEFEKPEGNVVRFVIKPKGPRHGPN